MAGRLICHAGRPVGPTEALPVGRHGSYIASVHPILLSFARITAAPPLVTGEKKVHARFSVCLTLPFDEFYLYLPAHQCRLTEALAVGAVIPIFL